MYFYILVSPSTSTSTAFFRSEHFFCRRQKKKRFPSQKTSSRAVIHDKQSSSRIGSLCNRGDVCVCVWRAILVVYLSVYIAAAAVIVVVALPISVVFCLCSLMCTSTMAIWWLSSSAATPHGYIPYNSSTKWMKQCFSVGVCVCVWSCAIALCNTWNQKPQT